MGRNKGLSAFSLAMISVGAVLSVRNFPSMAIYGWSSIGWYILGTVLFLLPLTLVSAELATGWNKDGGVYLWVKEAFGERLSFIAVFCEWSNNIVWFPTVLAFIAGTFSYAIDPALSKNGLFMFVVMMIVFWLSTLLSWFGSGAVAKVNNIGVMLGSVFPCLLLIAFGVAFFLSRKHQAIPAFTPAGALPSIDVSTLPFAATVILIFAGMEMSGFHAEEVKNPKRDFPAGMALAAILIFVFCVLGTVSLAIVVPVKNLNLAAGVMDALGYFFKDFGLNFLVRPMAILMAFGGFALLTNWLIGPILGLRATAKTGDMPPVLQKVNKKNIPVNMLLIQGGLATLVSLAYVFMPSVNQAYWLLSAITVLLLCITYMLMFAAAIRLRITRPDVPRPFKIPGGLPGIFAVAGIGFLAALFTFAVGLFPPSSLKFPVPIYVAIMVFGTALLSLPPLVFLKF
jgi:amino acid transporter